MQAETHSELKDRDEKEAAGPIDQMPSMRRRKQQARAAQGQHYLYLGAVKNLKFWTKNSKSQILKDCALILYKFELKILKILMDCEKTTRVMAHYHP